MKVKEYKNKIVLNSKDNTKVIGVIFGEVHEKSKL